VDFRLFSCSLWLCDAWCWVLAPEPKTYLADLPVLTASCADQLRPVAPGHPPGLGKRLRLSPLYHRRTTGLQKRSRALHRRSRSRARHSARHAFPRASWPIRPRRSSRRMRKSVTRCGYRSWPLVALGVRSISDRMTRNREDRSSNEKAPRRREEVKRGISRPSPLPKPKERPASKGRVHMGKTRN
jgi:hypothetical protein